jgi:DNA adenine methylase
MGNEVKEPNVKSTIKWVGSKKQVADEITAFFPKDYRRYFEPFLGGASIFLAAKPKNAYLSDLNGSLINYYNVLKLEPSALIHEAKALEQEFNLLKSQEQRKDMFNRVRSDFNLFSNSLGPENAARFLFLNKTAFNGIYRENSKGEFNVPFNNKEKLVILEEDNFLANSAAFADAKISKSGFLEAVSNAEKGDLVYFDPPYIPISSTSAFTDYTKSAFGPVEQKQLRDLAINLVERGVTVILSNSNSPEVHKLYKKFELHELEVRRLISAKKSSRGAIKESLIVGRPNV